MKKQRYFWLAAAVAAFGLAAAIFIAWSVDAMQTARQNELFARQQAEAASAAASRAAEEAASARAEAESAAQSQSQVDIPIDFDYWQQTNPEIYAWITIADTNIDYPILFSRSDDEYYLKHDYTGAENKSGALFTQSWNGQTFGDPVTVVYGHNSYSSGTRFYELHKYEDAAFYDAHRTFTVCLSDRILTYRVFAVYTGTNGHLLAGKDYTDPAVFTAFVDDIYNAGENAFSLDETMREQITPESRLLVLSTCNRVSSEQRFLVAAVLESIEQ